LNAVRVLAILTLALPVFAQYAGPAVLSRGDAPAALVSPRISFRPFASVSAMYDTGLAGVGVTESGEIGNRASSGVNLQWGVSGAHSWKRTTIGLYYRGGFNYFAKTTFFTSLEQSLLLGVSHQLSRHIALNLRQSAGIFTRPFTIPSLQQTVPFDPATAYIPTTDYFDNRTFYASSNAALLIQKSARMSFNMTGGVAFVRRRSRALAGTTASVARGDVQYRLSRRTTIGADYSFTDFRFTRAFGSTDVHGFAGSISTAITRHLEFSGYAGVNRAELQFIEVVSVDPVITALLGITSGTRVSNLILYGPLLGARLSRTFSKGVAYFTAGHTFSPGNGLFLTSQLTTGTIGYNYTGVRRWGLGATAYYGRGKAYAPVVAIYENISGGLQASRTLTHGLHLQLSYSARQYSSATHANYNRLIHRVTAGLVFSPGDSPLRP
jgi:hypothetical protein